MKAKKTLTKTTTDMTIMQIMISLLIDYACIFQLSEAYILILFLKSCF